MAAQSASLAENNAERIALGAKPDYDLKWALIQQGTMLRRGLRVIVFGAVLQAAGVLISQ